MLSVKNIIKSIAVTYKWKGFPLFWKGLSETYLGASVYGDF